jgi:hypothetical protein
MLTYHLFLGALGIVNCNIMEYLYLGKLKVGKFERKFCFQQRYLYATSYFAQNLHLKATQNIVFRLH